MTPKFTLITAVGAALVLAVPAAWGKAQVQPQWQQALELRSQALNRQHGLGEYAGMRALEIRSETLNRQYGLGRYATDSRVDMLDARERSFSVRQPAESTSMLDARERALGAKREVQLGASVTPDVFERAVAARTGSGDHFVANDDRFRIEPSNTPAPVSVTSSGSEIEWPQIGIGFGVGIALALGLILALRSTRPRPLAH